MPQVSTGITEIGNVTVPVTDHDRAIGFYAGILGMEVRRDSQYGPGFRWVEVGPAGAQTAISLASPRGEFEAKDSGIRLMTTDATKLHAELRDQGVDVDAELLRIPSVPPMFSFRDPDGNTLYIVESA